MWRLSSICSAIEESLGEDSVEAVVDESLLIIGLKEYHPRTKGSSLSSKRTRKYCILLDDNVFFDILKGALGASKLGLFSRREAPGLNHLSLSNFPEDDDEERDPAESRSTEGNRSGKLSGVSESCKAAKESFMDAACLMNGEFRIVAKASLERVDLGDCACSSRLVIFADHACTVRCFAQSRTVGQQVSV